MKYGKNDTIIERRVLTEKAPFLIYHNLLQITLKVIPYYIKRHYVVVEGNYERMVMERNDFTRIKE